MKKAWKEELKKAYEAPEPTGKLEFLSQLEPPELSAADFIKCQVGYIRKWNWAISATFFLVLVWIAQNGSSGMLASLAAIVPFLALSAVSESSRSTRHGMEELEMACRFSMKSVVMARLGVLGLGNLLLLGVFLPVMLWQKHVHVLYFGVYLLLPYLFTCFINLLLVRKIRGKESLYYCCGAAGMVSGIYLICSVLGVGIYDILTSANWIWVLLLMAVLTGTECVKALKQSEEYIWNW